MEKGSACGVWGLCDVGLAGNWIMDSNTGFCVYRLRRGQRVECGDLVLWVWQSWAVRQQGTGQWTVTLVSVSVFTGGEGVNVWSVGTWCCGSGRELANGQ